VGSGSVGSGSASRPVAAVSAAETDCSAASVKQFSDRAERAFNAGFPTAALALVSRALVCKPDDRLYRLAALYACAARDRASAQWSYDRLPAQARPAVAARCQQEKIALSEPSVASPARDPGADEVAVRPWTAAAPTIRPWCTASKVDDLVDQADKQFRAGAAALALSLYMSAIECRPDPMMYPLAAVYACVARDTDWAEEFYLRSQSIYQGAIRYRCQQEGISLRAPVARVHRRRRRSRDERRVTGRVGRRVPGVQRSAACRDGEALRARRHRLALSQVRRRRRRRGTVMPRAARVRAMAVAGSVAVQLQA
jgi:hypothetical protein